MNKKDFLNLFDSPVTYYRELMDLGVGIKGAVFLSHALQCASETKDPEGWFHKTQPEWERATGLARRGQESTRKKLREFGILEEFKKDISSRLYYRLNLTIISELLSERSPK